MTLPTLKTTSVARLGFTSQRDSWLLMEDTNLWWN